jgi:hypothetical protein
LDLAFYHLRSIEGLAHDGLVGLGKLGDRFGIGSAANLFLKLLGKPFKLGLDGGGDVSPRLSRGLAGGQLELRGGSGGGGKNVIRIHGAIVQEPVRHVLTAHLKRGAP